MTTVAVVFDAAAEFYRATNTAIGCSIASMILLIVAANMWVWTYSISVLGVTVELKSGYYRVEACTQDMCQSGSAKPWTMDNGCQTRGLALIASALCLIGAVIMHLVTAVTAFRIKNQTPLVKSLQPLWTVGLISASATYGALIALGVHILFRDCDVNSSDDGGFGTGPAVWIEWPAAILASSVMWRVNTSLKRLKFIEAGGAIAQPLNAQTAVMGAPQMGHPQQQQQMQQQVVYDQAGSPHAAAPAPQQQYGNQAAYSGQQPAAQPHQPTEPAKQQPLY